MTWGRSRRQRSSSTGASHSSTAINPLQGEIWRGRDSIQVSVKLVLKGAFQYYSTSSIQGCYNKRRSGWKIPRVLQFSKVHIFSLFFHNISTPGPHNLPVWDFRLEEARNHWISGDGDFDEYLAYPALILHRHVFSFNGRNNNISFRSPFTRASKQWWGWWSFPRWNRCRQWLLAAGKLGVRWHCADADPFLSCVCGRSHAQVESKHAGWIQI